MRLALSALLFSASVSSAAGPTISPVPVADGVYAVIGDLGGQTYENGGHNANLGFVVGDEAVLVINSGPTQQVASALYDSIRAITKRPIRWVVNVNSQNHYWHGNDFFKARGAKIVAHQQAARLMHEFGDNQLTGNRERLKDKASGTKLAYPDELVTTQHSLSLGGKDVQLLHFGPAHTAGDLAVWMPKERVLFSGDIVYTERMLAVIPIGNSGNWLKAFDALVALNPKFLVPGHGHPTDLARARRETKDYLSYLRTHAKSAFDRGENPDDFAKKLDQTKFRQLINFSELASRNANAVFLEIEKESF